MSIKQAARGALPGMTLIAGWIIGYWACAQIHGDDYAHGFRSGRAQVHCVQHECEPCTCATRTAELAVCRTNSDALANDLKALEYHLEGCMGMRRRHRP